MKTLTLLTIACIALSACGGGGGDDGYTTAEVTCRTRVTGSATTYIVATSDCYEGSPSSGGNPPASENRNPPAQSNE